jgi:dolichol kinase
MTSGDWIGLGASYAYATSLLALAVALRRLLNVPQGATRKLVHIGAGMWVFGVLALFDTWWIGVIPFATFIGVNFLLWRTKLLHAIDAPDSSPGTVYFAIAITLLFLIFWRKGQPGDMGVVAAAGAMAMTWGDALAAIVGQRFGRRHYTVLGATRSYEGSAAMALTAFVAILLTLLIVPGSIFGPTTPLIPVGTALLTALLAALVATLAEACSPAGTDNLSVPLLTAGTVFALVTALG